MAPCCPPTPSPLGSCWSRSDVTRSPPRDPNAAKVRRYRLARVQLNPPAARAAGVARHEHLQAHRTTDAAQTRRQRPRGGRTL